MTVRKKCMKCGIDMEIESDQKLSLIGKYCSKCEKNKQTEEKAE